MKQESGSNLSVGVVTKLILAVVGMGIGVAVVATIADVSFSAVTFDGIATAVEKTGLAMALSSLAEVLAAVLGLSITVVAIVVQLASARYPAKIVDIFMFDRVNIGMFAFMAASCVYVVVAQVLATAQPPLTVVSAIAILLTIANFGLLLPYFAYVFAFLEPTNLISKNQARMVEMLDRCATEDSGHLSSLRGRVSSGIERIADNCMAALTQSDRNLAVHSIKTLEIFVTDYLDRKQNLTPSWFDSEPEYFGTLSTDFVEEIVEQKTWVEAKSFFEFERVIRRALGEANEVVSKIANSTRVIGESAIRNDDREVIDMAIRFFNTYIRHGLNARNVRAVYNILYEYRRFAAVVFGSDVELGRKIVDHLVYYGRTANDLGLPFVTVTVAHDVRVLCEQISDMDDVDMEDIIDRFLSLDEPSERKSQEVALVGVRKAQSILGAFFLKTKREGLVEKIRLDMGDEDPERLAAIRDEILMIKEKKFWEVTDRGHNFEYIEPDDRQFVEAFYDPLTSTKN